MFDYEKLKAELKKIENNLRQGKPFQSDEGTRYYEFWKRVVEKTEKCIKGGGL